MKQFICCLLLIISFITLPSFAAQPDKRSEKADYQEEIEKLKKDNPKEYEKRRKAFVFAAQLVLAGLGYGLGPFDGILDAKTKSAIRTYQKKRNIPEAEDPSSFDTIKQLIADMNTMEYRPIGLPLIELNTYLWDNGFVSASGTWVLVNDKMAEPEQTAKINCSKNTNTCTEATAIVRGEGSDRRLLIDIDTYEIERWDDHEIVTKPLQTAFGCVRYVRRINRLQKSVTGIRSTISDKDMCKGVDPKEMYMVLTDGTKIYLELLEESKRKRMQLLNITPTFLQYLESLNRGEAK